MLERGLEDLKGAAAKTTKAKLDAIYASTEVEDTPEEASAKEAARASVESARLSMEAEAAAKAAAGGSADGGPSGAAAKDGGAEVAAAAEVLVAEALCLKPSKGKDRRMINAKKNRWPAPPDGESPGAKEGTALMVSLTLGNGTRKWTKSVAAFDMRGRISSALAVACMLLTRCVYVACMLRACCLHVACMFRVCCVYVACMLHVCCVHVACVRGQCAALQGEWEKTIKVDALPDLFPKKPGSMDCGAKGLELLAEVVTEGGDLFLEHLDLMLKWFTLRLCEKESTPTLIRMLEVLLLTFRACKAKAYTLLDFEADIIIPCVLTHGSFKKRHPPNVFASSTHRYPPPRV